MLRGWGPLFFLVTGFCIALVLYHHFDLNSRHAEKALIVLGIIIFILMVIEWSRKR